MNWSTITDSRQIPASPGVYVIFLDGLLTYIGQSLNMRLRLHRGHRVRFCPSGLIVTPWGVTRSLTVKYRCSARVGDEITRESRLIAKLQPPFNRVGVVC